MAAAVRVWEGLYRVLMRRNSVYVTFVVAGAFVGERVRSPSPHFFFSLPWVMRFMVDSGVRKLWEYNNVGVMYI
ncbi:hypothetical protein B296_00054091, partial [Ensete ventricosum]